MKCLKLFFSSILLALISISFNANAANLKLTVSNCKADFQEKVTIKLFQDSLRKKVTSLGYTSVRIRARKQDVKSSLNSPLTRTFSNQEFTPGFGAQTGNSSNSSLLYSYTIENSGINPRLDIDTISALNQNNWNGFLPVTPNVSCTKVIVLRVNVSANQVAKAANGRRVTTRLTGNFTTQPATLKGFYTRVSVG
jgi:hypothetical protein